jgi:hypothetical protein
LEIRLVSQIVDLRPEDRNTSSGLDITEFLLSIDSSSTRSDLTIGGKRIEEDNLLSLVVVGSVAVDVDTSGKVSGTGSISRPTRNEEEQEFPVIDGCRFEVDG